MNSIRNAEARDIPSVLRLLEQVNMVHHNGRPDLFKGPATKYAAAQLTEMFRNPKTPVFVCVDETDTVRGYVMGILKQETNDNILTDIRTLYIDDLCVDEAVRGEGIGQALYRYAVAFARKSGCYNVTLNVWTLNPAAMRFYEKCGMTPQKIGMEYILPPA
ncbi:MAG: GNAT family N-acetyltransferase [Oscillibacter sp.]|nr:GNAT family N-acetyltransferase [Oscillibacter sp.]